MPFSASLRGRFHSKSFAQDTAEKIGVTPRTVERKVQIAKNLTPEAKGIVKRNDIGFKNALKLSRLPPEQQEDAAGQLAAGNIHSVDEYQPVPAEPQNLEQRETSPSTPQASENYYPTIKASVEGGLEEPGQRPQTHPGYLSHDVFIFSAKVLPGDCKLLHPGA